MGEDPKSREVSERDWYIRLKPPFGVYFFPASSLIGRLKAPQYQIRSTGIRL
jgi:hypothetical protein